MGPLQVLSRSSYWCSLMSTPPLLLTHSPKMWLGETFQYTDHLRLTNGHCHFYLISSSLHQNLGTSVASFVLGRLPSWTLSTRTRGKKNHPWKNPVPPGWFVSSRAQSQRWPNSLASPSKYISCVPGDLGFHVHFATGSLSLLLTEAWWLVFSVFLDCQFIPSCKVILPL